jgi:hypothetical protein
MIMLEGCLRESYVAGDIKASRTINSYQDDLCEENLKILEEFGMKDYDIRFYDKDELYNRIRTVII